MSLWRTFKNRYSVQYRNATRHLRVLPDFIIIGAQKCGTSALYDGLCAHPNVASAWIKEVHFFDLDYEKGLAYYRRYFRPLWEIAVSRAMGKRWVTGEASPYYIYHPRVAARIAKDLPHVKLIVLLRNPVDRAFSNYQHEVRNGFETLPFEEALLAEEQRVAPDREAMARDPLFKPYNHPHFSYVNRGLYAQQLDVWFRHFPREQFFIATNEELDRDYNGVFGRVCQFLKIPVVQAKAVRSHVGGYNEQMSAETREQLTQFFRPHNERLYGLIGRDLGW